MNDKCAGINMKLMAMEIKTNIKKFDESIKGFMVYNIIQDSFDIALNQNIMENLKQSKAILIDEFPKNVQNSKYFILCFSKKLIIIEKSLISKFKSFFINIKNLPIHFLSNINEIFNQLNENNNCKLKVDDILNSEIYSFKQHINILKMHADPPLNQMIDNVISCIIGYLIRESYAKSCKTQLEALDHIPNSENFYTKKDEKKEESVEIFDRNDFIELRNIGNGSVSSVYLYYQISKGELVAIKNIDVSDTVNIELLKRENKNYLKIDFPLLPKLIGKIRTKNYPIIQFINGNNLLNIQKMHLNYDDKIAIIFQIMMIIDYLHCKGFVYRDLKPDNVMIDENKTIFIIDFDRMISIADTNVFQEHTHDFTQYYSAPEISEDKISFKNDIYSIGKMIYYIINEKRPPPHSDKHKDEKEAFKSQPKLSEIYKQCTNIKHDERPSISELMFLFYSFFNSILEESFIHSVYKIRYFQGIINYEQEYISSDIEKSIHYLSFAANHNDSKSQYILGRIYYDDENIKRDITKAVEYFTKAANQNNPDAQNYLAIILSEGKYITRDMAKAIQYFTKAADQNHLDAQYNLGVMYFDGKYVNRDINKGIYYLSHAADKNHVLALNNLGFIYLEGIYVTRNINKAIFYFSKAADQNNSMAQYLLGNIYSENIYIERDINKAIYYYTLAANQNHPDASNSIGLIYYKGEYIEKDINKSIYYFTLAADQNHPDASNNIGKIYSQGKYAQIDIKKALHYFKQAADQNHPDALNNIGVVYVDGIHVSRDMNKGIYYLTLAANLNHRMAQYNLGNILFYGKFVKRDINKGIYYLTLTADQNHPNAQYTLSYIITEGKYVKKDIAKAIHYLTAAANQNDLESQLTLGILYYKGEMIRRDVDKALYYLTLAANRNDSNAQNFLGLLYSEGRTVRDINKAIHYFSLAAYQNNSMAQFNLGYLYYENKYINKNIEKSIYYLSLAANQNHTLAQNLLGKIYTEGKDIARDINKAIHYYSLAANKYDPIAQVSLGVIFTGRYFVNKDINKAIQYFTYAAYQNEPIAQYYLFKIFSENEYCSVNMNKALYYLKLSAANQYHSAQLLLGDMYLSGVYVNQDIANAIKLYKEVSSFNNSFAKNNLGVIYKNGLYGVEQNTYLAKEYFYEAIRQKNDYLSIYNLSNVLIEEEKKEGISKCKSIESLIKSMHENRSYRILFCLIVFKKYRSIDLSIIKNEIKCYITNYNELAESTYKDYAKYKNNLFAIYPSFNELSYQIYKEKDDYIYINKYPVSIHKLEKQKCKVHDVNKVFKIIDINFYEGFGNDL